MAIRLADYEEIVGREVIQEMYVLAERVKNRRMQNINSTPVGGGVAGVLTRMSAGVREGGVVGRWVVI